MMNKIFSISRLMLLVAASSLVLHCHQTPWGAEARPARNLQQAVAPSAASNNNIVMASAGVLNAALRAARLCNLAYPETVLNDADAEASYTDPAKFQL